MLEWIDERSYDERHLRGRRLTCRRIRRYAGRYAWRAVPDRATPGPEPTMSARADQPIPRGEELPGHGSTFGAMLQEFNVAARLLNLDPGIWRILTHPKRQIVVSCPVQ